MTQLKAFQAIFIKVAALGSELSLWSHHCALSLCFAWKANGTGIQLHFESQATKMQFLALICVLRRLFGNQTVPVCEWKTLLWLVLVATWPSPWPNIPGTGLGAAAAQPCSKVPLPGKTPGKWSGQLKHCFVPG